MYDRSCHYTDPLYMNDTIQTAEDVERYLQLSTLGTIPLLQTDKKKKKRAKKHKRR